MTCGKNYLGLLVISDRGELNPEPCLEDSTANAAALPGTVAGRRIVVDSKGKETFKYVASATSKSS